MYIRYRDINEKSNRMKNEEFANQTVMKKHKTLIHDVLIVFNSHYLYTSHDHKDIDS
jgi:hypothetical protein